MRFLIGLLAFNFTFKVFKPIALKVVAHGNDSIDTHYLNSCQILQLGETPLAEELAVLWKLTKFKNI